MISTPTQIEYNNKIDCYYLVQPSKFNVSMSGPIENHFVNNVSNKTQTMHFPHTLCIQCAKGIATSGKFAWTKKFFDS